MREWTIEQAEAHNARVRAAKGKPVGASEVRLGGAVASKGAVGRGVSRKPFVVGLDPGKETGFALYQRKGRKLLELRTLDFWAAYDFILARHPQSETELVIEQPNSARPMYERTDDVEGQRVRELMAKKIGGNRREAELLVERFIAQGYEVRAVAPVHAKKWDAEEFKRMTGWPKPTNQHCRDAARLVFGL
jgi:hypothetical protein